MQVSQPNDVKVYNLSAGKSLPEWVSDRKKRQLLKGDIDLRRRIELIQNFDMPTASQSVKVTPDGQYLLCCGVYKPRLKGFDLSQLSQKFDRCFNSECVKFEILSEDYSKLVLLQADRYVEFHAQYGTYYRTRMPKFGRDLVYHKPSCDLFLVGDGPDVFRLNLDRGQFMQPYVTDASSVNVCRINADHQLLTVGTYEGKLESFDSRARSKVGILDLADSNEFTKEVPSVTALSYKNELEMAVGTSSGHILIYDIRSNKPKFIKDHQYELPIVSLSYHKSSGHILSADSKIIKLWNPETGRNFTSIEPGFPINDVCVYQDSGLIFLANEFPKNSIYFIPELGEAPRWCSFLDNITEELEESNEVVVYDDYKFVTQQELDDLGLDNLRGTSCVKAYMHGFFIDVRLYHKAKSIVEPFAYQEYRKNKIRAKIEEERASRIKLNKMPKVNKMLATKLIGEKRKPTSTLEESEIVNPLEDDRFASMFSNRDFEIDIESEEYKLINPVVSKREKERRLQEGSTITDSVLDDVDFPSSDDETIAVKKNNSKKKDVKIKSMTSDQLDKPTTKKKSESLGDMLKKEKHTDTSIVKESGTVLGQREMTFLIDKPKRDNKREAEIKAHKKERKKVRRPVGQLLAVEKKKATFWRGKRVK